MMNVNTMSRIVGLLFIEIFPNFMMSMLNAAYIIPLNMLNSVRPPKAIKN